MVVLRKANASTHVGLFMSKLTLPQPDKKIRSLTFYSTGKVVWIVLGATLSSHNTNMTVRTTLFTANDEWKPVDMSDIRVKAGSALDFSKLVELGPAGKHGRVIARPDGRLAFSDAPDQAQRFFGYNMVLIGVFGTFNGKTDEETKANIREYIALVKRQGYNVLRSLCLDTYLMSKSQKDLELNPDALDRFDYFVSVMKQEGIYLYLDLAKHSSLDEIPLPDSAYSVDKMGNEFGAFLGSLQVDMLAWYQGVAKEIGYRGLHSLYDYGQINRDHAARAALPAVAMHGYHAHPSGFSATGSQCRQDSSVGTAGGYWRSICGTRLLGKPFLITEHNHAFWNQYVHEDGLLFSAYSALQDFSCVLVHENAVWLEAKTPLIDFDIGRSPIGRANEVIATCLYRRGDVTPAKSRVELRLEPDYLRANMNRPTNSEQTKLALLCGFGLNLTHTAQAKHNQKSDLVLAPAEGTAVTISDWAVSIAEDKSGAFSLPKAVDALHARGLLPANNLSNPAKGIYQSDTGELTLFAQENRLTTIHATNEVCFY